MLKAGKKKVNNLSIQLATRSLTERICRLSLLLQIYIHAHACTCILFIHMQGICVCARMCIQCVTVLTENNEISFIAHFRVKTTRCV